MAPGFLSYQWDCLSNQWYCFYWCLTTVSRLANHVTLHVDCQDWHPYDSVMETVWYWNSEERNPVKLESGSTINLKESYGPAITFLSKRILKGLYCFIAVNSWIAYICNGEVFNGIKLTAWEINNFGMLVHTSPFELISKAAHNFW